MVLIAIIYRESENLVLITELSPVNNPLLALPLQYKHHIKLAAMAISLTVPAASTQLFQSVLEKKYFKYNLFKREGGFPTICIVLLVLSSF